MANQPKDIPRKPKGQRKPAKNHQYIEPKQFSANEDLANLKGEFSQLKDAYILKDQQLYVMNENFMALQQSYQNMQLQYEKKMGELVTKLEKSYDAYHEKFVKVEELEEKLKRHEDEIQQTGVQKRNLGISKQEEYKKTCENNVNDVLSKIGLSLVVVDKNYEIAVVDYKKLTGLLNDLSSLAQSKNRSEHQDIMFMGSSNEKHKNNIGMANTMNMKTGKLDQGEGKMNCVLVEWWVLKRITTTLKEQTEFVANLKNTINEQNTCIEVLMDAMKERKTQSKIDQRKYVKTRKGKEDETLCLDRGFTINLVNGFDHTSLNTVDDEMTNSCTRSSSSLQNVKQKDILPRSDLTKLPERSGKTSQKARSKKRNSNSTDNRHLPGDTRMEKQSQLQLDEVCPICNMTFDREFDIKKRNAHINSHFE
ncbi:uncharacterized protein LOC124440674 [Xenia sp. Carnegie-2017]|uniref:uncharacterized protein LOC124440674 n=1 Tax=Xenia sp. Carnegie-2017 TaxID=2897299 RepID=UPI001F03A597|nr:uncharacterized protein LOC124440674 [Xenia sp. Carnegie-2017]